MDHCALRAQRPSVFEPCRSVLALERSIKQNKEDDGLSWGVGGGIGEAGGCGGIHVSGHSHASVSTHSGTLNPIAKVGGGPCPRGVKRVPRWVARA